jgi:membrane-bound lytic murein transglycosylase D
MFRCIPALAAMLAVIPVLADDGLDLRVRRFSYPPAVLQAMGPSLSGEVTIPFRVDRSLDYLLDISEEELSGPQRRPARDVWDRIRNGLAMKPLRESLVAERERWYRQRKDLVVAVSAKARRYLHHIVEAVERRGLPMELALLPFVESGFEPNALSRAQAAGLWQFIPGTAQRYRLRLDDRYDARRDIVASTDAALDYLEFLHGWFKDWHLALAAYNWGEEAVQRAIQRNQARGLPADYESLVLPAETRHYVPRLMAVRSLVLDPARHGIELAEIPNAPYFKGVELAIELDAPTVARLAGLPVGEVLALNPSYRSGIISGRGRPPVLLPADRVEEFMRGISALPVKLRPAKSRREVGRKAVIGLRSTDGRTL